MIFKKLNFLLILVVAATAFSQVPSNSVGGIVTDPDGAVIGDARIELRDLASGKTLFTRTDETGKYLIGDLSRGNYLVVASAEGFSDRAVEIRFGVQPDVRTLNFVLSVGDVAETVTVTATRTQIAVTDTAVPVSVVERDRIERENLNTIGDIFRKLPGTTSENEGAFQVRPRIRGLDSNRVLVLVDGERLNNARTSTTQSGIETGLVGIDEIETVEVVRGGGSVLYGTDALGGTVNIITKNAPARSAQDGFRLGAVLNGFFSSNEKGRRGNLALRGGSRYFSFRLAQTLERYDNYQTGDPAGLGLTPGRDGITPEGEVLNSQSHGGNTQLAARFFFAENADLRLGIERRRARNIGSPRLSPEFGFNAFFPFSNRDKYSGRLEIRDLNKNLARISGSFYFQNQKRNFSNILKVPPFPPFFPGIDTFTETITDTNSVGFDLQTNWLFGSKHFFTAGTSFFRDTNRDERFRENRIPVVSVDRSLSVPDADFGSIALFVQDQFEATGRLSLTGGVRIERFFSGAEPTENFSLPVGFTQEQIEDLGLIGLEDGLNVRETTFTGDLGAVYKITGELSLTGRIGRSYRVANLFERFFTGPGSIGGFVVANPDLEPETGINFDAGIKLRHSKFAGSLIYFSNHYRNFLSNQPAFDRNRNPITLPGGRSPIEVFQTVNIGRARIQGFEADFEMPVKIGIGFLTPAGNFSYLRGDNLSDGVPLNTITPFKTVLNLRWRNLQSNYYADWTTRIVGKQKRLSPEFLIANGGPEPGFAVSDIGGGYTFRKDDRWRMSFNVGLKNVFDRYYTEQFVFAPARGRSFVFGTTLDFDTLLKFD